jgi:hypothetical protein
LGAGFGDSHRCADPRARWLHRRRNQRQQHTPLENWALNTYHCLIETVFSPPNGHMHSQQTDAKPGLGLVKRVMGIVTAYTLGIYLNVLLPRRLLALKARFA